MIDLTGLKFGELEVIARDFSRQKRRVFWFCRCSCGKITSVVADGLRSGGSRTCGCSKIKHGNCRNYLRSRTYRSWEGAKSRCLNPNDQAYHSYGARGITFYDGWLDFNVFKKDMGECPAAKTLDRIDNNKGYSPSNCRWATMKEQSHNRRNTVYVEYNGKEYVFAELVEHLNSTKLCSYNYQHIKKLYQQYGNVDKIIDHYKNMHSKLFVDYNNKTYLFTDLIAYLKSTGLCLYNRPYIKRLYRQYGNIEKVINHFDQRKERHYAAIQ
jgi:hypothetical protein